MKKITETIVTEKKVDEEYVVNGEGCLDDCPKTSWVNEIIGCGQPSAFLSKKH